MKRNKILALVIVLAALLLLTTTVLADPKSELIVWDPCDEFEPLPGAQIYCGELKDSGYQIEVPDNWNGDLLMWVHGQHDHPTYLWVDAPPFREWLIQNGYAWAASSFSANGAVFTEGIKDTKALASFFQEEIAVPEHIYISGISLGGGISVKSVEQYPELYDGGLPFCGSIAPYEEYDAVWDYYVLITALAGMEASYPIPADFISGGDFALAKDTLAAFPGSYPYVLNTAGEQLKAAMEIQTGGERPLYDQAFTIWYGFIPDYFYFSILEFQLATEIPGVKGVYMDNWDTVYQFDMDSALTPEEQALNEIVFRIERDPQAMHPNGLANMTEPTGKLRAPILDVRALGDMLVPFSIGQIYAQRVAEQGASDFLVQRAIRDLLHCEYTVEESAEALTDLVNWVETGVKPAGDDFLDPLAVSDPFFGCQFTTEHRDYTWVDPSLAIPPCP